VNDQRVTPNQGARELPCSVRHLTRAVPQLDVGGSNRCWKPGSSTPTPGYEVSLIRQSTTRSFSSVEPAKSVARSFTTTGAAFLFARRRGIAGAPADERIVSKSKQHRSNEFQLNRGRTAHELHD